MPPLFGLAPGGVCHAAPVTSRAVRSYRTLSPLPLACAGAVCSLWHFPWGHPRRALPATVVPWSPDFPRRGINHDAAARPSDVRPAVAPRRRNANGRFARVPGNEPESGRSKSRSSACRARSSAAAFFPLTSDAPGAPCRGTPRSERIASSAMNRVVPTILPPSFRRRTPHRIWPRPQPADPM